MRLGAIWTRCEAGPHGSSDYFGCALGRSTVSPQCVPASGTGKKGQVARSAHSGWESRGAREPVVARSLPCRRRPALPPVRGHSGWPELDLFAPAGSDPASFETYVARINSCGGRLHFPSGMDLKGLDLRNVAMNVGKDDLRFELCNVSGAELIAGTIFALHTLARGTRAYSGTYQGRVILRNCDLEAADFSLAIQPGRPSSFDRCSLHNTSPQDTTYGMSTSTIHPTSPPKCAMFA